MRYSPERHFLRQETEVKKSDFYRKLTHFTLWTCEQLDALREERFGPDLVERTKYVKDFDEEFSQFNRVVLREEFLAKVKDTQLVFGGDIHDLEKATENLIQVLEYLSPSNLVVGVECIKFDKQKIIDNYLAGKITEKDFLKKSGLLEFIPQQARNYLKIFQKAKEKKMSVLALDSLSYGGVTSSEERKLEQRDEIAAQIIVQHLEKNPSSRMYVIFGQAHLAENHLPAKVKEKYPQVSSLVFVQNVESLYNQALEKFGQIPLIVGVAEIEKNKFAILDTSPLEVRYERLRHQFCLQERINEAMDSAAKEFFPYLLDFLAHNFNLELKRLCFQWQGKKCEINFQKLLANIDIGYNDKELESLLSFEQKEKLKKNKVIGFIQNDTPILVMEKGARFKELVKGSMEILLEALEKAHLREKNQEEDEVLIYLGTKIAKPDLRPTTEKEQKGEEWWQQLIRGEGELKIV
jgi:uncharacterized iron-regulated protein